MMNTDQVDGRFTQIKGKIKETWGKLSDNDIMLYKGQHDQFLGKLKEYYGISKDDAEKKLKVMEDAYQPSEDKQNMTQQHASSQRNNAMPRAVK